MQLAENRVVMVFLVTLAGVHLAHDRMIPCTITVGNVHRYFFQLGWLQIVSNAAAAAQLIFFYWLQQTVTVCKDTVQPTAIGKNRFQSFSKFFLPEIVFQNRFSKSFAWPAQKQCPAMPGHGQCGFGMPKPH